MKLASIGKFLSVSAASLLLFACPAPTETASSGPLLAGANQVTATVTGIVLDGMGNPVPGVEVSYSNGNNPSLGRSLERAVTNNVGQFELQFLNETSSSTAAVTGSSGTYITFTKDNYTSRRILADIPTIQQIRAAYGANLKADETLTIKTPGSTTAITVESSETFSGFHAFLELGQTNIYFLDAEVSGTILLKKNSADPESTAVPAPEGSLVQFILPGEFSPQIYEAVTDATGKFLFSPTAGPATYPADKANPLPVFANTNGAAVSSAPSVTIAVQPSAAAMGVVDSGYGAQAYEMVIPQLMTSAKSKGGRTLDMGNLFAIADNKVRLVGLNPVNFANGVNVELNPLTATDTPTPLTFTFSKAVNTDNLVVYFDSLWLGVQYNATPHTVVKSADNLSITVTPSVAFQRSDRVRVYLNGLLAADGSAFATATPDYYTKAGLLPVSASWLNSWGEAADVGINDNLVVNFNMALAAVDLEETGLWSTSTYEKVPAQVTFAGTSLTINPDLSLDQNVVYEVRFKVKSGLVGDVTKTHNDLYLVSSASWPNQFQPKSISSLRVVSASWLDGFGKARKDVGLGDDVVITFSTAPTKFTAAETKLLKGSATVSSAISIVGSTLVINPDVTLEPGVTYTVEFEVATANGEDTPLTETALTAVYGAGANQFTPAAVATLRVVDASWLDEFGKPRTDVGLSENLTVQFSANPASFDPLLTKLEKFVVAGGTTNATAISAGSYYKINTLGTTNWVTYGASSNTVGLIFKATAVGTGSGTANLVTYTEIPSIITLATDTLTINPGSDLASDTSYKVSYSVKSSVAGDVPATETAVPNEFKVPAVGTIKLLTSNVITNNLGGVTNFAAAGDITLTFDSPVQDTLKDGTTPYTVMLLDSGDDEVPATVTLSADRLTVTINPTENLVFGGSYYVEYNVYNGVLTSSDSGTLYAPGPNTTDYFTVTTGGVLTAPVLSKDSVRKQNQDQRSTYDSGETALFIGVAKVANTDSTTPYSFQYRITPAGGTAPLVWTNAGAAKTYETTTSVFYEVTVGAWNSGDTVEVKAKAEAAGGYVDSPYSAALSFTDQTAATSVTATGLTDADPVDMGPQILGLTLNTNVNTSTRDVLAFQYKVQLNGNVELPTATGTITGATYDLRIDPADPTVAIIDVFVNKATAQTFTAVASTALVTGAQYTITTAGTSDFTQVGAASNTVGTIFRATGTTTGTGTATLRDPDEVAITSGLSYIITGNAGAAAEFTDSGASVNDLGTEFIATNSIALTGGNKVRRTTTTDGTKTLQAGQIYTVYNNDDGFDFASVALGALGAGTSFIARGDETIPDGTEAVVRTAQTPAGATVVATALVNTTAYIIASTGTTDFTAAGAPDSNVGTVFVATGAGAGDGTARALTTIGATSIVNGRVYMVVTAGTSDYTTIGAADNNPGTFFTANAAGTGTGTVVEVLRATTLDLVPNNAVAIGSLAAGTQYVITKRGTSTQADFETAGAARNNAVGDRFDASATAATGTGYATVTAVKAVDPSGVLEVNIADAAGNDVDFDTTTAAVDPLRLVF